MIDIHDIYGENISFDSLIYPTYHVLPQEYINAHIDPIINKITDTSKTFVNSAKELYNNFTSMETITEAKNAVSKASGIMRDDIIMYLPQDNLHNANLYMQKWIIAQPDMRKLYLDQRCDGFFNTYADNFPGDIKDDHYDYRRVMDGVLTLDEDDDRWLIKCHTEELILPEDELSVIDKFNILDTWENVKLAIANGDDPSNPDEGGSL